MRAMLGGLLSAGAFLVLAGNAAAQQSYAAPVGIPASPSQPVGARAVPAQTMAPGTIIGQPVIAGAIVGQPVASGSLVGSPAGFPPPVVTTFPAQGNPLPYSYWVSAPNPSRVYVEYGSLDQFPFHGRPYGSAGDRWSWYYMGGGDSRFLARYYYPPLR